MTGWRLGWLISSPSLTSQLVKAHMYGCLSVGTLIQEAAARLLNTPEIDHYHNKNKAELKAKSRWFAQELQQIPGFELVAPPDAGFYLFADIRKFAILNGWASNARSSVSEYATQKLLETCKIAVVPGTAFGALGEKVLLEFRLPAIGRSSKKL